MNSNWQLDSQGVLAEKSRTHMNLLNLFRNAENVERYSAGQKIFEEGQPGDVMYVLLEGEVEILAHDHSIATLGPGDLLGEFALIDTKARSATAVALSDCRLAPVNEKRFLFMVEETPFFALHVMRSLTDKLRLITLNYPEGLKGLLHP